MSHTAALACSIGFYKEVQQHFLAKIVQNDQIKQSYRFYNSMILSSAGHLPKISVNFLLLWLLLSPLVGSHE